MPYKFSKYRRRRARRPANTGLATRPVFKTAMQKMRQQQQVSQKLFYFKVNGQSSTPAGSSNNYFAFRTKGFTVLPDLVTPSVIPQRDNVFAMYDQYKVLSMRVKWFPVNVGTEPGQVLAQGIFNRGDQVIWSDQRFDDTAQVPILISEILNHGSARMIQPRRFQTRSMFRPKGFPRWGSCEDFVDNPDPWNGAIQMIVNNATEDRPLWYYTLTYKVAFRGRRQN